MTTQASGLLDRYQDYRIRRWLVQEQRLSGMLPGWRTRTRRRALVVTVAATIALLFTAGLLCAFDLQWASLIAGGSALVFLPAWTMLRIASQGQDHAPAPMLDEREIAQRNAARSIGLTITQGLTIAPVMYLCWSGALAPEADTFRTAFAGGVMTLATVLAGGCAPAMILGWTQPEPEPES
ncbi:hypothetical protein [Nocardia donostiensis]|uniref:Uncharacterized protein n=1 Tax=Nocardia donostiensis TaxID=1538463 RepID=A0A1V2TLM4_9NOCA|nr:hypothetical protein [Nocardia donostiensis]ONM50414.1 hypothetical protein B0T46_00305 [Nocardia donostiensis]OQS17351.1 hypothetical protein B0T36_01855 [Nocardia donostiensis]OQS18735.1 hypothetical protein B0T44_18090 [Nocardia donostiensis]